jgi:hypothetical protein
MLSTDAASAYEKEAISASDLYQVSLNIKDKSSPDSMEKTVNKQHTELVSEKAALKKELAELKRRISTYDHDFLDDRQDQKLSGEKVTTNTLTASLQDGALSFFLFAYLLFGAVLISFAFMPPLGDTKKGVQTLIGFIIMSIFIYGLIFNYA